MENLIQIGFANRTIQNILLQKLQSKTSQNHLLSNFSFNCSFFVSFAVSLNMRLATFTSLETYEKAANPAPPVKLKAGFALASKAGAALVKLKPPAGAGPP